jgi:hypothetical protein
MEHLIEASAKLVIQPTALVSPEGTAVEEVLFLRYEVANMAWAVERSVQGCLRRRP